MSEREKFSELLYKTHYNNFSDSAAVKSMLAELRQWLFENTPSKLYRFRPVNKYSILALENDEIWGGRIGTFNDPYECMPGYNIDTINEYINAEFSVSAMKEALLNADVEKLKCTFNQDISDESIYAMMAELDILKSDPMFEYKLLELKRTIISQWQSGIEDFKEKFFEEILLHENMYHIACFSESNTSTLMWAHYANSHTGFCIEYDFKSMLSHCPENCMNISHCTGLMLNIPIAPVSYQNSRYDASAGFMSMLVNWLIASNKIPMDNRYYDLFLPTKLLLTKSDDWKYENEWRIFRFVNDFGISNSKLVSGIKPTGVYLGTKIKAHNKNRIVNICKNKNIPCFQLTPQFFASTYEPVEFRII